MHSKVECLKVDSKVAGGQEAESADKQATDVFQVRMTETKKKKLLEMKKKKREIKRLENCTQMQDK